MNVDTMINICWGCVDDWRGLGICKDVEIMKQIIAALKAGQAMRDSYYTSKVAPGDNLDFDKAVEAWDVALEEEV